MYLTSALAGFALVSGVLAHECNANNCARAVTGTRAGKTPGVASRMADCSSFMMVTVTPAVSTATATATVTITAGVPAKRQYDGAVTVSPSVIPAYASPCTSAAAYSSACSCWGITATTTTAPTPVTTVTVTATVTVSPTCPNGETQCSGACADLDTDPDNCGACGNVCASGVCANGACSNPTCAAETCDTFTACGAGGSCVCGSTTDTTGFCVDGSTPCSGLPDCGSSSDCATGEVCIVGSCCNRNVCIGATVCGGSSPARMIFARGGVDTVGHRGGND